jgi:hypothetical protein
MQNKIRKTINTKANTRFFSMKALSVSGVFWCRETSKKIAVGTQVFKLGDWENVYQVCKLRPVEPRYLQLGNDRKTQEWMITEDLEFDLNLLDTGRSDNRR